MIISTTIKSSYFGLRIQNLAIFNIGLDGKLTGEIDGKIDLDHALFMPKFCAERSIDGNIFLTLILTLTGELT